jgi:hypothetical protein
MRTTAQANPIDWDALVKEFETFEPADDFKETDPGVFSETLVKPVPGFVGRFLKTRSLEGNERDVAVRDLYAFLLGKRYDQRVNLLYFAFDVFCDPSLLPEDIVNQTPFPHEDGHPRYKYRLDPDFEL